MSDRSVQRAAGTVCKVLVTLIGATGCLAAAAYAATGQLSPARPSVSEREAVKPGADVARIPDRLSAPLRPRIVRRPRRHSLSTSAAFKVAARTQLRKSLRIWLRTRRPSLRFICRLDGHGWRACPRAVSFSGLSVGRHRFSVRVIDRRHRISAPRTFRWTIAEPREFSIATRAAPPASLYPGVPPSQIPLLLTNPNPVPISVTRLEVEVTASPPGCDAATNLKLISSSASVTKPAVIPAGGSLRLPVRGVSSPAIGLRNLPVNQDSCKGARFALAFHGRARG